MARKTRSMDGNNAAAHVAYAFTDVAGIYPITPSSVMAELTDLWSASGQKNIFGQEVKVVEMQSEAGAAGVVHGSLASGALTTTFTASQGLLLMIPNMYKIAGELLPCVIHVSARAVASHALSIFGDHSDVMACRSTGFAMLAATNPQEVMDLGAVAHLSAIRGRIPFLHFFDGFRTSHEIQKVETWAYEDLARMIDWDSVNAFRASALNPEHPVLRGTAQNPDIFFQAREACNPYYDALPSVVEEYMMAVNQAAGTDYQLFNYYGAPDADRVIVAMGSVCDMIEEVVDYLNAKGEKVGLVKVRLYRPFVADKFAATLPRTCKKLAVLDRTKEPGALGEPLYLDVVTALAEAGVSGVEVAAGRYGLGSKDTPPSCAAAVFANLKAAVPQKKFTVGITDDVTHLSLPVGEDLDTSSQGTVACKFWGLGGDGTVGANKNSIKIIGDHTDLYSQAYFAYDSKKTGGITVSHLRFGKNPIKSTYYVSKADFVACHNPSYVDKYELVQDVKPGGTFLLNCDWDTAALSEHLPSAMKAYIAQNDVKLYTIDAIGLSAKVGLGKRTNTVLQAAFFALADILPAADAVRYMKEAAEKSYGKRGPEVVRMNHDAIDAGAGALVRVDVPSDWADAGHCAGGSCSFCQGCGTVESGRPDMDRFVKEVLDPVSRQKGDLLPVSAFKDAADGTFPQGSAAFEKRGVAVNVPEWQPENCIQCCQCAFVCPHAAIRPYALNGQEQAAAPDGFKTTEKMIGKGNENYKFAISVDPMDCMGCVLCANVCPAKNKALVMKPLETQLEQQVCFDYAVSSISEKETGFAVNTVKGSQFKQPLLEFSGACAGCVETAYARIVTQLFGDRMYIANATGCSSIWGGSAPSTPYTVNKEGKGPAWANSLFEDNAEFGYGMYLGQRQRREKLVEKVNKLLALGWIENAIKETGQVWLDTRDDAEASKVASREFIAALEDGVSFTAEDGKNFTGEYEKYWDAANAQCTCDACAAARDVLMDKDLMIKKAVWIFGGDGWAYDIGFGGLDHVLASGEDVNVFVFDTEVYSNTGGQASKSSQIGQVAQFAAAGKSIGKKDLAAIAMSYGYVYVAQVGIGANYAQTVKAIAEAEAYPGPSIIIGYAPCEMHGIKGGMANSQAEIKAAVEAGYWHLFRYDPRLLADGKSPFQMDSKAPTGNYVDFIKNEVRYTSLERSFPNRAAELFDKASQTAAAKFERLQKLGELYKK